ncbi:MAG: 50S ribosomal protein L17 [bacterium]|nr:50S ribosomal protein L17 [bacterium]
MRHRKKKLKLNRTAEHRKALLLSLTTELFKHETIKTTLAKAKMARGLIERLISLAKVNSLANHRRIVSFISNKEMVKKLEREIAPNFSVRQGGYTQIIKLGRRHGDSAEMAIIKLVKRELPQKNISPTIGEEVSN